MIPMESNQLVAFGAICVVLHFFHLSFDRPCRKDERKKIEGTTPQRCEKIPLLGQEGS
jgi:hypothetical protein